MILSLWSTIAIGYTLSSSNFCEQLAGKSIITGDEAIRCYNTINITQELKVKQIETIEKTLGFYAFLDLPNRCNKPQILPQSNIMDDLRSIKNKDYKLGYQFYRDIVSIFNKNNDGHTKYSSECFEQFKFIQPFPLIIVEENGKQVVRIAPKLVLGDDYVKYWLNNGLNVYEYSGAEVLSINSWPSLIYLQYYSDEHMGVSRESNSRLNSALAHPTYFNGEWSVTNGMFAVSDIVPNTGFVSYSIILSNGRTADIKVPHLVKVPSNFKPGMNYNDNYCSLKKPDIKISKRDEINMAYYNGYQEVPKVKTIKSLSNIPKQILLNQTKDSPLSNGPFTQTYKVTNETGVLVISTFSTDSPSSFYSDISNSFGALKRANVSKLIIDLSNNGGGISCLSHHLLNYLFPGTPIYPTDFRLTPLFKELLTKSDNTKTFMDSKQWLKVDGNKFSGFNEFLEERVLKRSFINASLSQPFIDNCPINPLLTTNNLSQFSPSNIAIVSNGVCLSTCALFANALQEFYNVASYVVGGNPNNNLSVASLSGGAMFTVDKLIKQLNIAGLKDHPGSPKAFSMPAELTFTIREAYSYRDFYSIQPKPLEFKWFNATKRIPNTLQTFNDPLSVWRTIAKDFV